MSLLLEEVADDRRAKRVGKRAGKRAAKSTAQDDTQTEILELCKLRPFRPVSGQAIDRVKVLLKDQPSLVNVEDAEGNTPLLNAVSQPKIHFGRWALYGYWSNLEPLSRRLCDRRPLRRTSISSTPASARACSTA